MSEMGPDLSAFAAMRALRDQRKLEPGLPRAFTLEDTINDGADARPRLELASHFDRRERA